MVIKLRGNMVIKLRGIFMGYGYQAKGGMYGGMVIKVWGYGYQAKGGMYRVWLSS